MFTRYSRRPEAVGVGIEIRNPGRYSWMLPAVLGTMLLAVGCNNTNPPLNPAQNATPVSATENTAPQPATVTTRDIIGQVVVNGQIIIPPSARADLYPPFRATVNRVDVSVGSEVNKGQTLVELAMPSAEAYHEQTKAALQDAETAYANAKRQYQSPVDAAQKQLDAARAAAKSGVSNGDNSTSSSTNTTDTNLATSDVATAEQALLQAKADYANQMLPYQQELDQLRAANQQARMDEKQGYIRPPISGTVIALNAQPGKEVTPDVKAPIATVVNLSDLQLQATMTPQQAGYVKPGMEVALNFDEIPAKTFNGKIARLTSQPNNTAYVAIITFKNTDNQVKPGMKPHIAIKSGQEVKDALAVPSSAVRVDPSGKPVVTVMRDGKWQTVAVEPGISDSQFTEIKSGLKAGETVQVQP